MQPQGPVILVGHSYGGAIISVDGNAGNVAGLMYIGAFPPEKGESLGGLLSKYPLEIWGSCRPPKTTRCPRQRFFAKRANRKATGRKGSHAIFISQPKAVADVIEAAAKGSAKKSQR
ncbi:alpha/beta hydrolase [Chitinophaga caseinilytica]|uniref:Alpha/beta hydrolase n=1 Tax=Chitinophaga caseinilytica TaxID=2267521 RepID=A0ABZ2Z2F0_9BACT